MKVIEICVDRTWTLQEAREILPLLKKVFEKHESRIKILLDNQRFFMKTQAPMAAIKSCDDGISHELKLMGGKFLKLGIKVYGNNFIGFDSGEWFWSYQYPEEDISYFHGYVENPLFNRHKIGIIELVNGQS